MLLFEISDSLISRIIKKVIREFGFSKSALCSGGRCYEFRDEVIKELTKNGILAYATDSVQWLRYDAENHQTPVGYAEAANLEENNHAWIYIVTGNKVKHYDALNPEGVVSPRFMTFFKHTARQYHFPDKEEQYYRLNKYHEIYDRKTDKFIQIPQEEVKKMLAQLDNLRQ